MTDLAADLHVHRLAAARVRRAIRAVLGSRVAPTPLQQRDHDRQNGVTGLGEHVLVARALARLAVGLLREHPRRHQLLESLSRHRFGDPDPFVQRVEPGGAVERLAHEQHRRPVADELHRAVNAAPLAKRRVAAARESAFELNWHSFMLHLACGIHSQPPSLLAMPIHSQSRRTRLAIAILTGSAFLASLDLFIVNVAFDEIGRDFGISSLGSLSWILNAYAVVYAALLVPMGRLTDRYGRKSGFVAGMLVFTLASLACGFAPGVWWLVGFRVAQAAGAALMTPASLGLLLAALPPERRAAGARLWAMTGA